MLRAVLFCDRAFDFTAPLGDKIPFLSPVVDKDFLERALHLTAPFGDKTPFLSPVVDKILWGCFVDSFVFLEFTAESGNNSRSVGCPGKLFIARGGFTRCVLFALEMGIEFDARRRSEFSFSGEARRISGDELLVLVESNEFFPSCFLSVHTISVVSPLPFPESISGDLIAFEKSFAAEVEFLDGLLLSAFLLLLAL